MRRASPKLWFDTPVLGSLDPDQAARKLADMGDVQLAEQLRSTPAESDYRKIGRRIWPIRPKAWQHTTHAIGYISPLRVPSGLREIKDVADIDADPSLIKTRVRVTLDAFRIAEYPGSGTHHILLDFYAQNQVRPITEHLHFNATYRVRQGEQAAIRGYPIFIGLSTGNDGLALRCYTVNVKNENDQALLNLLDSDTMKAGLKLAITAQPAIGPLSDLAHNLTKGLLTRNSNVPVQDIYLGLDFGDSPTGARLRLGSYLVVQVPEQQVKFSWSDWVLDSKSNTIVRLDDAGLKLPYNYLVFAISKYEGP